MYDNDSNYVNPFLEPYKSIVERKRGGLALKAIVAAYTHNPFKTV